MESKIRCIVAEDYMQLNELYNRLLSYEDDIHVVGTAFNGRKTVNLVKQYDVDVILMDIEMEVKKDGIETCRKVLELKPDIKVVMLTCHYEQDLILAAYEAGAVDYVLKTESSSVILESVRSAYRNNSPIRPNIAKIIRNKIRNKSSIKENKDSVIELIRIITQLTSSEIEILNLLAKGMTQNQIAEIRYIEVATVKSHINSILKKFNMKRTSHVIEQLKKTGLIDIIC